MRISATEEYGLRCLLQLARSGTRSQSAASAIANAEGISVQYASKMMHLFRKAGLVESVRGLHGGFRLVRAPEKITLREVFVALGAEPATQAFCDRFSGDRETCVHISDCAVRPVWHVLFEHFDTVLTQITLGDLISGEAHARSRVSGLNSASAIARQTKENSHDYT